MKIAFSNIYEDLNKSNFMFLNHNAPIGDNLLTPLVRLKEEAAKSGIEIGTVDVIPMQRADAVVFFDFPGRNKKVFLDAVKTGKPLYLIAIESPLVNPEGFDPANHGRFRKVFTWSDELITRDPARYVKINYSYDLPFDLRTDAAVGRKLCTLIAGNKSISHPKELYSKRVETIRWFERNHPDEFDLYGTGWDEYSFSGPLPLRLLNRVKPLRRLLASDYPSYRGTVERKREVLERYKFAICYENASDIPGYVTEKIFDCFFAGCVPVYLGADNVAEYIPSGCYIDRRSYATEEQLYGYIADMDDSLYAGYLDGIKEFLSGEKAHAFSCDYFVRTLLRNICGA